MAEEKRGFDQIGQGRTMEAVPDGARNRWRVVRSLLLRPVGLLASRDAVRRVFFGWPLGLASDCRS